MKAALFVILTISTLALAAPVNDPIDKVCRVIVAHLQYSPSNLESFARGTIDAFKEVCATVGIPLKWHKFGMNVDQYFYRFLPKGYSYSDCVRSARQHQALKETCANLNGWCLARYSAMRRA